MILVLLLQAMTLQDWVDVATKDLAIKPVTVVETARLSSPAATDGSKIYVHPLVRRERFPAGVLQFIAYHEVCHIALKHRGDNLRQFQKDADRCALAHIYIGAKRKRRESIILHGKYFPKARE